MEVGSPLRRPQKRGQLCFACTASESKRLHSQEMTPNALVNVVAEHARVSVVRIVARGAREMLVLAAKDEKALSLGVNKHLVVEAVVR